jgi:uncharacterized Zn finger protein
MQPHLVEWVESHIQMHAVQQTAAPAKTAAEDRESMRVSSPAPVDPSSYRRQARQILRGSRDWDYYAASGIASQISTLLDQVGPFLEAGDGDNALRILEAITEPYVDAWYEFDDSDGDLSSVFSEIGPLFAEAILSANLSSQERRAWQDKLTTWQGEVDEYGVDEAFDVAIAAATQGWDDPPLQAVLQGHITEKGAWQDEAPWYADELAVARLNVLERQGRTVEYLYLAEAEGQTARYLTMLVKLGRSQEAVEYGRQYMATTDEALALAQALRAHGRPGEAVEMAGYGLTLHGETVILARWLRDFALELSRPDVALTAARAAFARSRSLEDYQAAQAAAGSDWPAVKADLLAELATSVYGASKIEIYLYEDMVDEAVKTADSTAYLGYDTLRQVVDAAWQKQPDWVIRQCRRQAEDIMDAGKSQNYHHAISWLERARRAYLEADRAQEWRSYLEALIEQHKRKYSLRPGLEGLRR